jgi:hypothetical protein
MNGETQNTSITQRVWQVAFGVVYVALFVFLFAVKPAPEQRMRASIGIAASSAEVSRALDNSAPIRTLAPERVGALLLTKKENTDVSVAPQPNEAVLLTIETHWQVRGGLIGRALDQLVGRPAREQSLRESLRTLKMEVERAQTERAAGTV